MPDFNPDALQQSCPACGIAVDVADAEPLAHVACPGCGEKFDVQRAFDNFLLIETLGAGGMSAVYKARDTRLDRFVALKLLHRELSADPAEAARLEQEARVTASVNHPNVVQVYSVGTAHRQIYLVMELVDHGSLDDLIAQHARLPEAQVLSTAIQVARGLKAAHERGLIHRDVKPANILYADAQTAKIGDFGLAVAAGHKTEAQNEIWGTPYYVAPERLNNEPEDFRSDIYSLGATLFHVLAARPPIEGETTSAAELRQLKSHPLDLRRVAPDVSAETARIVNRMLSPKPENRFATYKDLIDQLQRAYLALSRDGVPSATGKGTRIWKIAAIAALLATAGAALYVSQQRQVTLPAPTADVATLQRRYNDARRQLVDGKYDAAAAAFATLNTNARNVQPLQNWIRLHRGLTALLQSKFFDARAAFQELERSANFSTAKGDEDLVRFFTETARVLLTAGPARARVTSDLNARKVEAFAIFAFAVKNWQMGEFAEAATLLEKFDASEPPAQFAWMNDYKLLARKFLADDRLLAAWRKEPQRFATAVELSSALTKLRALESQLQTRGAMADALKNDEKRLVAELAHREKTGRAAEAAETKRLVARQMPIWNAALAIARKRSVVYDFAGALAAVDAAAVSAPPVKDAQADERKRIQWLISWKTKLISDLRSGRYTAPISDLRNVEYQGVVGATDTQIILRIPGGRGAAPVKWTALSPRTLLAMSTAFIAASPSEAADRQWLSAVFAQSTGQAEAAKTLSEAAAATKPEYREQLAVLKK